MLQQTFSLINDTFFFPEIFVSFFTDVALQKFSDTVNSKILLIYL
jgi:hypothetical protein